MNVNHASIWWLPQISQKVPTVYPADASMCNGSAGDILYRCIGVDRTVHFAQHAAISHLYAYGTKYNLPYVKRVPRGISGLLVSQKTIEYLINMLNGDDINKLPVKSGYFQPQVIFSGYSS